MVNELARSRPAEILLVEDNENDVLLTRQGFKRAKLMVNLHHVRDGEECMRFLRKQAEYADAPTPDMVLLDLNMPKMDGREVLAELVKDENLCHLPVVILTTSAEEREILDMYRLRCSSYIVKPVDFNQFLGAIRMIGDYWFTVVVLPTDTRPCNRD
jgi:two-component system, chemotaxis family, response regulator Rcp1